MKTIGNVRPLWRNAHSQTLGFDALRKAFGDRIEVGDYRKPLLVAFRGFGGFWKECAQQTVKELRVWVESNREAIYKNRVSRP